MSLEITNLCKSFGDKKVLHNLNMRLEDGGIYCLMGPSGMGKTTLLRIIMNLETKDSGSIRWISQDGSEQEMNPEAEISAMFQEDRLLPFLNAIENVNMMYEKKPSVREISSDLSLILPKKCLRQPTSELSGGMKRRVSLARTMHFQGKMIILDEPFTGLDMKTRKNVIEYVLKNRRGRILLVATHGEEDAELLGGKIIRLEGCQDVKALQVEAAQKQIQREEILLQAENMVKQMDSTQLKRLVQMMKKMQENTLEANEQEALVSQLMGKGKVPVMADIPREEWSRALRQLSGKSRSYEAGEILWNVGDVITDFPVILKGCVDAYMVNDKGQESEISRFTAGNCFGEMLPVRKIPSPVLVKALEPTEVIYLSKECLKSTEYDSENALRNLLLWGIIDSMADKLEIVTDKLDLIAKPIEAKILAYLEKMPEDEAGCRVMDRSQTELADYFQISRQSLSRELAAMETKGQILKVGVKNIKVLK